MTWDEYRLLPRTQRVASPLLLVIATDRGHSPTPASNSVETVRVKQNYIPAFKSQSRAQSAAHAGDGLRLASRTTSSPRPVSPGAPSHAVPCLREKHLPHGSQPTSCYLVSRLLHRGDHRRTGSQARSPKWLRPPAPS